MTHRIGSKGQVVIPKELRDVTGLKPGAEVDFVREGNRITLIPRTDLRSLAGFLPDSGMAQRLLEDRAREPR